MVSTRLYIHDNILSWNVKGKNMNERTLNEFAAYYKRVIRVERYLKDLIYEKYTEIHGSNAYLHIYNRYLSNLKTRQQANDKTFFKIYRDTKDNLKKLEISIDKMYTSEVLAKMRGKLVILFALLCFCLPCQAVTLHGSVQYTAEQARQEAFDGVKNFDALSVIGVFEPRYYFDLNALNDVLVVAKTKTKLMKVINYELYTVVYKDSPNKEYIYEKGKEKNKLVSTITKTNYKHLKYSPNGELLSIEYFAGNDSFLYNPQGELIGHWKGLNGKEFEYNLKSKMEIMYSAQ